MHRESGFDPRLTPSAEQAIVRPASPFLAGSWTLTGTTLALAVLGAIVAAAMIFLTGVVRIEASPLELMWGVVIPAFLIWTAWPLTALRRPSRSMTVISRHVWIRAMVTPIAIFIVSNLTGALSDDVHVVLIGESVGLAVAFFMVIKAHERWMARRQR